MTGFYLDANATTPLAPEVLAAMQECQSRDWGNASSQHAFGRRAHRRLEDAREEVGRLLGAKLDGPHPDRVLFTSGGTESNHLGLLGLANAQERRTHKPNLSCYASAIEHPSVLETLHLLEERDWKRQQLPVGRAGVVSSQNLERLLREGRTAEESPHGLAALMLVNHETGAIQPVAEAAARCKELGVPLHCDAVQAAGKLSLDFSALGPATLSISAHKFHGPQGVGALLVRGDAPFAPDFRGGFQQFGWRPGTEPVWLIVGLQVALRLAVAGIEQEESHLLQARESFEAVLRAGVAGATIHAAESQRVPTVSNVAFPGVDRQAFLVALDLAEIACSTGSACASGSSEPSPTLLAMGCESHVVGSSLRFSWTARTPAGELASAAARICNLYQELRRRQKAGIPR